METIDHGSLKAFVAECFQAQGLSGEDADLVADSLVQADLWGHPSHGVMRTFWYGKRLGSGAINARARPGIVGGRGAMGVMDGGAAMGQVVAQAAMDAAMERARDHGIAAVSVRNGGHFGTAMYFTRMAARHGMIGFLSTNASPAMAPWGGREKRLGNNPWSWAAPAGRYAPMMLDIANTAVARGKLHVAAKEGRAIPEGWAMDAHGRMTIDPAAGIEGVILPMAGHKGYAIAALTDVLSGILSGSAFAAGVTGPYVADGTSGAGHLAIAIDITATRPLPEFEADMETLIETLKATPRASGVAEIFYPGEPEHLSDLRLRAEGITLPDATLSELRQGAKALGITSPF